MSIKLITLNLEGDKHLDLALPFLKQSGADVICLQELFEADVAILQQELGMTGYFAPMSNMVVPTKYKISLRGPWGVGFFTRLPHSDPEVLYYKGQGTAPIFTHPYDNDQVLIVSTVEKDGLVYQVGTTHFTWSPDGQLSPEQAESFEFLKVYIDRFSDLVLCGDFNAPRGRKLFAMFSKLLTDNLPEEYTTTIDKNIHYAGDLQLVVDTIFSKGKYTVSDVHLVDGVSDHLAVVGNVSIRQ